MFETKTTTLSLADYRHRTDDTCGAGRIRLLTVSRIDPRKGLRVLPAAVAELVDAGHDVTLDIVGPTIGLIGDDERDAIRDEAARLGVADRVTPARPGRARSADAALPRLRRVRAADAARRRHSARADGGDGRGLPVVTTNVSGIASLITHGENGLLDRRAVGVGRGRRGRAADHARRRCAQRLIQGGYATARAHTLERQAAEMMAIVVRGTARCDAGGDRRVA